MLRSITRAVSPAIAACELTYLERQPIDYALAVRQHAAYEDALASLGVEVIRLLDAPGLPDAVFVEDTAVVLDEIDIMGRSGVESRRGARALPGLGLDRTARYTGRRRRAGRLV